MSDAGKGVLGLVGACVIWGASPLFYKLLAHVPATEVLAHRSWWSLVFFGAWLAVQGRLSEVAALLRGRRTLSLVALAAVMVMANWFLFIWSVANGRTVETALGYYIFPLISVLLGVVVHREGMGGAKALAVALAALGVVVLTLGLGTLPWISLTLAVTFAIYGLIKKNVSAGPVVSVTAEVVIFAPVALGFLALIHLSPGQAAVGAVPGTFGTSWRDSLLLMLSGPVTASPLVLFSYGARRVTMGTTGLVQYLNPTLQFVCATLVFAEPFTRWHAIAFPLIWAGLALYSVRSLVQESSSRRAAIRVGTSSTAVK